MSDLQTEPIPADVDTNYLVWALDVQGRSLVGDTVDEIEALEDYRAYREDNDRFMSRTVFACMLSR